VRQQRSVDLAVERRGVHHQHRSGVGAGRVSLRRAPGDPRFVAVRVRGVVLDPGGVLACAVRARGVGDDADLLFLPDHDGGRGIAEHERQFGWALPPIRHAHNGSQPAGGHQDLKDAMTVLSPPQHPIAGSNARVMQLGGQCMRTSAHLLPGDAAPCAHRGERLRSRRGVLIGDVV